MSENDMVRVNWTTGDVSFVPRVEFNRIMREYQQEQKRKQRAKVYAEKHPERALTEVPFEEGRYTAGTSFEDVTEKNSLLDLLHKAKQLLTDGERELIDALYSDEEEVSGRVLARQLGCSHTAIQNRHEKIIERLRELMDIDKF